MPNDPEWKITVNMGDMREKWRETEIERELQPGVEPKE